MGVDALAQWQQKSGRPVRFGVGSNDATSHSASAKSVSY